jgi:hypothetical protein
VRYDWLVTAALSLHFAYLVYVVLGGFLAWRWPKAWFVHLAAAGWGILIVGEFVDCPLTWAENWAREKAGRARVPGFIDHYITGVIYPEQYLHQVQVAVAVVVLGSWIGALLLWRRRRNRARAAAAGSAGEAEPGDAAVRSVEHAAR